LAALDATIVSTALPTIAGDLHGLNHLSWVVTAYLLTATVSMPLYGKLGDLFGRRTVFLSALLIFLGGSLLAGLSQTMFQLCAFRAIQGLGAGGLMSLAGAIIGDVIPPRERGRYQGYGAALVGLVMVAGPAIGGIFTQQLNWRWCFFVNLPIGAVCLVITAIVLNLPYARIRHRIDYPGALLLIVLVSGFLWVTQVSTGWTLMRTLGALGLGMVVLALFLWREKRADEPVVPLRLFRNGVLTSANVAVFALGAATFAATVYLPLFLQLVTGAGPARSGLVVLPLMVAIAVGSIAAGRVASATGRYKATSVVSAVLIPIGLWQLSLMTATTSTSSAAFAMVVLGLGLGGLSPILIIAVQNAVDRPDLGVATSLFGLFRSLGGAFGVAVLGRLMTTQLQYWFPRFEAGHATAHESITSLAFTPTKVQSLPGWLHDAVVMAFSHSLRAVFLAAIPVAAVAVPATLWCRARPLRTSSFMGEAATAAPATRNPDPAPAAVPLGEG
jgi:EmrB/QacA subfamily drug resistance transporter